MTFNPKKYSAGAEVDKCRDRLSKYCLGDGLDIGCGGVNTDTRFYQENKITETAIGIDLAKTNLTGKADNLPWLTDECMGYVFSSHLLEHLEDPSKALMEWFRVLEPCGCLIMYLPLYGYYPDVGEPGANSDHKHNLYPKKILMWLDELGLSYKILLIEERVDNDEYSFYFVIRKFTN